MTIRIGDQPLRHVAALLCDADGTLFPSEEPAYEASAAVTNRLLADLGAGRTYEPSELQQLTNGKNFRSTAGQLADTYGRRLDDDELERWVAEEKDVVTAHLQSVLGPDPEVAGPLTDLVGRLRLAVVTSSASTRLDACLEVTGLAGLFDPARRFSAESSMPRPVSKPDPAVYAFACQQLSIDPAHAVAVEDSVNGALSAVAAGIPTLGTVQFVPLDQRPGRVEALLDAGVLAVVEGWSEIARLLDDSPALESAHRGAGA